MIENEAYHKARRGLLTISSLILIFVWAAGPIQSGDKVDLPGGNALSIENPPVLYGFAVICLFWFWLRVVQFSNKILKKHSIALGNSFFGITTILKSFGSMCNQSDGAAFNHPKAPERATLEELLLLLSGINDVEPDVGEQILFENGVLGEGHKLVVESERRGFRLLFSRHDFLLTRHLCATFHWNGDCVRLEWLVYNEGSSEFAADEILQSMRDAWGATGFPIVLWSKFRNRRLKYFQHQISGKLLNATWTELVVCHIYASCALVSAVYFMTIV